MPHPVLWHLPILLASAKGTTHSACESPASMTLFWLFDCKSIAVWPFPATASSNPSVFRVIEAHVQVSHFLKPLECNVSAWPCREDEAMWKVGQFSHPALTGLVSYITHMSLILSKRPRQTPHCLAIVQRNSEEITIRSWGCIANQFGHASAAKFAEGRGATTSHTSTHVSNSGNSQAEACPN